MTPSEWQSSLYLFDVIETNVPLPTGSGMVVSANPNRISLMIGPPNTGAYNVSTLSNVTSNTGFLCNPGVQPFQISAASHGALVAQAWYCATQVLGTSITVIEVLFKDR